MQLILIVHVRNIVYIMHFNCISTWILVKAQNIYTKQDKQFFLRFSEEKKNSLKGLVYFVQSAIQLILRDTECRYYRSGYGAVTSVAPRITKWGINRRKAENPYSDTACLCRLQCAIHIPNGIRTSDFIV
jgi:hypothetical protein